MASVDAALSVPEFLVSTPDELQNSWLSIDLALEKTSALLPVLRNVVVANPQLRDHLKLLQHACKQVDYQKRDATFFRKHYLGELNREP